MYELKKILSCLMFNSDLLLRHIEFQNDVTVNNASIITYASLPIVKRSSLILSFSDIKKAETLFFVTVIWKKAVAPCLRHQSKTVKKPQQHLLANLLQIKLFDQKTSMNQ